MKSGRDPLSRGRGGIAALTLVTWIALVAWVPVAGTAADAPSSSDASVEIPLRVVHAGERGAPDGSILTTGVPFADGALAGPSGLRVVNERGEALPTQLEARGTWPRSGATRWLGVSFPYRADDGDVRLVRASDPAPAPSDPVHIERRGEALLVTTGALRAEIVAAGCPLRSVRLAGREVLRDAACSFLRAAGSSGGARAVARAEGGLHVEREGPLHAVVRVEGRIPVGASTPWVTLRMHFHAGRPEIRLQHTFVWDGSADSLQIAELGLAFPRVTAAGRALAAAGKEPGQTPRSAALPSDGVLSLLQGAAPGEPHRSRYRLRATSPDSAPRDLERGKRTLGVIATQASDANVTLGLRDFWQRHPSELRATPGALEALFWSDARGAVLDLRFDGFEASLDPGLRDQLQQKRWREAWQGMREPNRHNPHGLARTHDLLLHLADEADASGFRAALAFDRPTRVLPDPDWTTRSGVLGQVAAVDEARSSDREARHREVWDQVAQLVDDASDYGLLLHGSGPHFAYEITDGRPVAQPWRYSGVDYGYSRAAWVAWLRSGERAYVDLAVARSAFMDDVLRAHRDGPSRRRGDWYFWGSGPSVIPWGASRKRDDGKTPDPMGLRSGFGLDAEHTLFDWWLHGNARSRDVAREIADAMLRVVDDTPGWPAPWIAESHANRARAHFQWMDDLAVLYTQFGDPRLLDAAGRLVRAHIRPDEPAGVRLERHRKGGPPLPYPTYLFYDVPHLIRAARVLDAPTAEQAERAVMRSHEHALRTRESEPRQMGGRMADAYARTGDARYLAHGLARAQVALGRSAARRDHGYDLRLGAVPSHASQLLFDTAALAAVLPDTRAPLPTFPVLWKEAMRPAARALLWKREGHALRAEIVTGAVSFETPDGEPWPADWTGPATAYVPYGSSQAVRYREVHIPAPAPPGAYAIDAPWSESLAVLSTDAEASGLVAPGGLALGDGSAGAWAFIPVDSEIGAFASSPKAIAIRDARGRRVPIERSGWTRLEGSGRERGPWHVRARRSALFAAEALGGLFAFGDDAALAHAGDLPSPPLVRPDRLESGPAPGARGPGWRLSGPTSWVVPVPVDPRAGALELHFAPDWDSGLLPDRGYKPLLSIEGASEDFELRYGSGFTTSGEAFWELRGYRGRGKSQRSAWIARGEGLRAEPGRFVRLALVWSQGAEGERSWGVVLNGRPAEGSRHLSRLWPVPDGATRIRIGPSVTAAREGESLDAVVDELVVRSDPLGDGSDRVQVRCDFGSPACTDGLGRPVGARAWP